jgi:antitoxin (DNA-binding transcriptional repressor) of toxin-antitoxin stability system
MHDAKTRLSQLGQAALDGEELVLCSSRQPKVRLTPVNDSGANLRDLTPDPRFRVEMVPGFDPAEPLSEDEWPKVLR